jgi:hypothetical protein
MLFVAYTETIVILPMLFFGMFFGRNSPIALLVFAHFLRLRYFLSPQTRSAIAYANAKVESGISHPNCPKVVARGVRTLRRYVGLACPMLLFLEQHRRSSCMRATSSRPLQRPNSKLRPPLPARPARPPAPPAKATRPQPQLQAQPVKTEPSMEPETSLDMRRSQTLAFSRRPMPSLT